MGLYHGEVASGHFRSVRLRRPELSMGDIRETKKEYRECSHAFEVAVQGEKQDKRQNPRLYAEMAGMICVEKE